jgi:hypothetical protein
MYTCCAFSEVNSGFFYKTSEEREKMVIAERAFITERVLKIIALKKKLCDQQLDGEKKNFVVINQKVSREHSCIRAHCIGRASIRQRSICLRPPASSHCDVPSVVTWSD